MIVFTLPVAEFEMSKRSFDLLLHLFQTPIQSKLMFTIWILGAMNNILYIIIFLNKLYIQNHHGNMICSS